MTAKHLSNKNKCILMFAYLSSAVISIIFFLPIFFTDSIPESFIFTLNAFLFDGIWLVANIVFCILISALLISEKRLVKHLRSINTLVVILAFSGLAIFARSFFGTERFEINSMIILLLSLNHLFLTTALVKLNKAEKF